MRFEKSSSFRRQFIFPRTREREREREIGFKGLLANNQWDTNITNIVFVVVENKGEILPDFSLEITQYAFTKRGGIDEAWTKSLS